MVRPFYESVGISGQFGARSVLPFTEREIMGFGANYSLARKLEDLSPHHFLVLAYETAVSLGWTSVLTKEQIVEAVTEYYFFKGMAIIKIYIQGNDAIVNSESVDGRVIDFGLNENMVRAFWQKFDTVRQHHPADGFEEKFAELMAEAEAAAEEDEAIDASAVSQALGERLKSVFFYRDGDLRITNVLITLNALIYFLMVFNGVGIFTPDTKSILEWGAAFLPYVQRSQWWRLLTSCFIHFGIVHLLFNMYALYLVGIFLEPVIGNKRFLTCYLLSGIVSTITSLYWHDDSVIAGASGAIFGMYGIIIVLLLLKSFPGELNKSLLSSFLMIVVCNLLPGVKGNIDLVGHIGGLAAGIIFGLLISLSLKSESSIAQSVTIGLLVFLTLIASLFAIVNLPGDILIYERQMKRFYSMDAMALEVLNMPDNTPKKTLLSEYKERGLYYWQENLNLLDSLDRLHLSKDLVNRNKKLREYVNLRLESYNLMYKKIDAGSDAYDADLAVIQQRIIQLLNELK